ncbi:hypothetical protein JXI42_05415 [bacterium]|nr:hypothetical protein [bacterium]
MDIKSIEDIKTKFKDEWVLLADYETDKYNALISGKVIAHSKDRGEIYNLLKAELKKRKKLCIKFMGSVPQEEVAVMFYGEIQV